MCGRGSKWKVVDVRGKEPSQRAESRTSGCAVPSASLTRRAGWASLWSRGCCQTLSNRVDLAEFGRRCGLSATLSDCNYAAL